MKIVVLSGAIASGKSTYACNAARKGYICVNDDAIVNLVHGGDYTLYQKDLKILYKSIENHIVSTALAMGKSVIIDRGRNNNKFGRKRWIALANSYDAFVEAIVFKNEGPEIHAKRRFQHDSRGHTYEYWFDVASAHQLEWEEPSVLEGLNAVHSIPFSDIIEGKIIDDFYPVTDSVS